jgi:5-dehydro-2-deoxygluconokinase
VVFDADFRPVLWGLVPIGKASIMEAQSATVSSAYLGLLGSCDLVVGTEEEVRAMTGTDDPIEALAVIRAHTDATVVVKSGALGATAHPGAAPLSAGVRVPSFKVDILNTVGAGDGFMSGFLSRWVHKASIEDCLRAGNAAGALVATRHGCMSAMPVAAELDEFLARGGVRRPQDDERIRLLHRLGTRPPTPARLFVLAMDHRWQLEELVKKAGAGAERLRVFKTLLAQAFLAVAAGREDCGILVDEQYGASVLEQMAGAGLWTARAIDVARSRPVELLAGDEVESYLRTWPADHVVKVMCYAHPADSEQLMDLQLDRLGRLTRACRATNRELLVELQAPEGSPYRPGELATLIERLYRADVQPEWWKLPPLPTSEAWEEVNDLLEREDPSCRGVLLLGSTATRAELASAFGACAEVSSVRGFAIGRALFSDSARKWLAGQMADDDVVSSVAAGYEELIRAWSSAAALARGPKVSA